MNTIELIKDQLQRSFVSDAWHGSAVLELLESVDHETASFRASPEVHSIWELVLHMTTWKLVVADRVEGRKNVPSDEQDWPDPGATTGARWRVALKELRDAHHRLETVAARVEPAEVDQKPPTSSYTRAQLFHGIVQHDLYHAGQIGILKKMAEAAG